MRQEETNSPPIRPQTEIGRGTDPEHRILNSLLNDQPAFRPFAAGFVGTTAFGAFAAAMIAFLRC